MIADTRPVSLAERYRLDGKMALVTGAGRGIGRAAALALSERGANVIGVSRTPSELASVGNEITASGGSFESAPADVTSAEEVERLFGSVEQLDVLVHCAGGNRPGPFLGVDIDTLRNLVELNLISTFLVDQAGSRLMAERGGSVINLSSQMGHVGAAKRTVYCATKHAVEGLTKAMAVELAPLGIRVNAVAPTFIETPMTAPFLADQEFRREVEAEIPLGRIGQVEDVVGAICYLASPAAAMVTGTSLLIDGGWTAK